MELRLDLNFEAEGLYLHLLMIVFLFARTSLDLTCVLWIDPDSIAVLWLWSGGTICSDKPYNLTTAPLC